MRTATYGNIILRATVGFPAGRPSFAEPPKAVPERRGPLPVIEGRAVVPAKIRLHKIFWANIEVRRGIDEERIIVGGQAGNKSLLAADQLNVQRIAQALREREGLVLAAAEGAVEFRVVRVGGQSGAPDIAKGYAETIVERGLLVGTDFAFPDAGVQRDVFRYFHAHVSAEALEEVLVQQSGNNQSRVERGKIAEIIVIDAKTESGDAVGNEATNSFARCPWGCCRHSAGAKRELHRLAAN